MILFDGMCQLCSGFVQFVLKRDKAGYFDFAPLQSQYGESGWDSVVLLEGEQRYEAEVALLRVLARLNLPWPWVARFLGLLPTTFLRRGYRVVARNRYRWFGREETSILPRAEWKGRLLS